jgi:thiol-disulfide isomerase/thioredoxin
MLSLSFQSSSFELPIRHIAPGAAGPGLARGTRKRCGSVRALLRSLLGGACLCAALSAIGEPPRPGGVFPNLGAFGLEGAVPDVKGKVALIDFWASWCVPCKKSFPVMKELTEKFGPRGFVVVAVSVDENKGAMDAFLKKNPNPFVVVHDAKGRLAEAAGVEKMPTSFLVGPDGKVLSWHSGFDGEATRKQYLVEVESALKAAGK